MAFVPESANWEEGIYQYEETDVLQGGPNGIDNLQAKQIANRLLWLREFAESLGVNKQPLDATLTALAGLVGAADKLAYFNGADSAALTPLTAFARTLLDDADAATARATLAAAPLASPTFTGTPAAPTASAGTNTTQLATTAFVQAAVAALVASSPAALNTLNELAAALGNDANFATTMTTALAGKQPLDATLTALAGLVGAADKLAYFNGADSAALTPLTAFARTFLDDADAATARATLAAAPLASPTFTGTPAAPTASAGTNTTQLATTAFVQAAVAALVASSPAALNTLNELAAALGNDANFATTMTTALAGKQPLDATLTALAGLVGAADKLAYFNGADSAALTPLTAFARTLLDDADAATARATLGAAPSSSVVPPGAVIYVAASSAPTGFLKANGAAISRTTYASLFTAIGTTFGAGDGVSTFNLPDLRGEFVRGYDDGRGIDSGRILGSWQKGSLIAVDTGTSGTPGIASYSTRSQSGTNPTGSTSIAQSDIGVDPINTSDYPQVALVGADGSAAPNIQSGSTYGTSGSARPRNVAMLACIKY